MIYFNYERRKYYIINNIGLKNENYREIKGEENG